MINYRVRVEVLRAIGTRLTNSQRAAYCVATQAKPYLSVGPAAGSSAPGFYDTHSVSHLHVT